VDEKQRRKTGHRREDRREAASAAVAVAAVAVAAAASSSSFPAALRILLPFTQLYAAVSSTFPRLQLLLRSPFSHIQVVFTATPPPSALTIAPQLTSPATASRPACSLRHRRFRLESSFVSTLPLPHLFITSFLLSPPILLPPLSFGTIEGRKSHRCCRRCNRSKSVFVSSILVDLRILRRSKKQTDTV
jgi:hypothetical protein